MNMKKIYILVVFLILIKITYVANAKPVVMRVSYFPNITHSQAIIGMAKGEFQKKLGGDVIIEEKIFNAGPSAIEAMFAQEIDLSYIGPNPAINGYVKSEGKALRIVAGASSGGASLVVRSNSGISKIEDFHGKKIASPQLGNTQDVSLRGWLKNHGLKLSEQGGDVQVLPINNPDQLTLFLKNEIDAAWTVEPWVSRLIIEGEGKLFLDERSIWPKGEFVTAHIIVSNKFLSEHRDLVKKWLEVHIELTGWINNNLSTAKGILNGELKRLTGRPLSQKVLDSSFYRIKVTYDPIKSSLFTSANWAFQEGFLGRKKLDLSGIYDLSVLNEILKERKLRIIK